MKLKLTEPGWENFTGLFGAVNFENGVSVDDVSAAEARHLAACVRLENAEDGSNPSVAQEIIDNQGKTLEQAIPAYVEAAPAEAAPEQGQTYTADELMAVADKSGIKGLRVIGDAIGVKGASIAELIGRILEVAGTPKEEPAVEPVVEAAAETPAEPTLESGISEE